MFYCAISGEPPQEPVVSNKSGHVYERRLIVKYILENGTDPMTGEKLEEADLVTIRANPKSVPPRPPNITSIPALLQTLQNEWDALVLETFNLKQQYHSTRQELSQALYQQDAATRVVARVLKERDAAREALISVQTTLGVADPAASSTNADVDMNGAPESSTVLPAEIADKIDALSKTLSSGRKKRKVPADYTSAAQLSDFQLKTTVPSLHKSNPSGINSFALSQSQASQFLTGGNDKIVQLYDCSTSKIVASLTGHTKKITHVAFREVDNASAPRLILSGSLDKTARIWSEDSASGEYAPQNTFKTHKGEITGLSLLPTNSILALTSADQTYSLQDLSTFQTIYHSPASESVLTACSVHPDGLLLATGTNKASLQIYDLRSGSIAATLSPPDAQPYTIPSVSFSENGYHLCAPGGASTVNIWDLRHLSLAKQIDLGDDFKVNRVKYDPGSALFIGVAGNKGLRVYRHKTWDELVRLDGPDNVETVGLDWSPSGADIWGLAGREVRKWGLPDA